MIFFPIESPTDSNLGEVHWLSWFLIVSICLFVHKLVFSFVSLYLVLWQIYQTWNENLVKFIAHTIFIVPYLWKTMETEKQLSFSHKVKEHRFARLTFGAGFPHFSLQDFGLLFPLWVSCWSKPFCYSDSTPCSLTRPCCLLPGPPSCPALTFSVHPPRSAEGSFSAEAHAVHAVHAVWTSYCLPCQLHFFCSFVH